jgi:hypothetical protein
MEYLALLELAVEAVEAALELPDASWAVKVDRA